MFKDHNTSFLVRDLFNANKTKNKKIVKLVSNGLIDLRNAVNENEIFENENSKRKRI